MSTSTPAPTPTRYHAVLSTAREFVNHLERTKLGAQLFRVARLTAVGLVTAYVSHSAVDSTAAVAIAEAAFRQVFG